MTTADAPLGVCCCPTVKHALSPRKEEETRELIRQAAAQGKQDLVDFYAERLTHCTTAYNRDAHKQVA